MKCRNKDNGFTLVELLVSLAIFGIIAAIAVPSYQHTIKKSRRTDAQTSLHAFASAMERYHTTNGSYVGSDNGADALGGIPDASVFASQTPTEGSDKFYDLRVTVTAGSFSLFAIPAGPQSDDGKLKFTSTGEQSWDRDNDNTYTHAWF